MKRAEEWAEDCCFEYMESDYRASREELAQTMDANRQAIAAIIQQAMDEAAADMRGRAAQVYTEQALKHGLMLPDCSETEATLRTMLASLKAAACVEAIRSLPLTAPAREPQS